MCSEDRGLDDTCLLLEMLCWRFRESHVLFCIYEFFFYVWLKDWYLDSQFDLTWLQFKHYHCGRGSILLCIPSTFVLSELLFLEPCQSGEIGQSSLKWQNLNSKYLVPTIENSCCTESDLRNKATVLTGSRAKMFKSCPNFSALNI